MPTEIVSVPLALSYDTRDVAAVTNMAAGKDQRRVNCYYEILRGAVNTNPTVILTRRPGVTVNAGTYGVDGQVPYLVGYDPGSTYGSTAWVYVKDGTITKVANLSTTTTILDNTNYYPRFQDVVRFGDNQYAVVQLQRTDSEIGTPSQKVYYATAIGTWTEISDATFTGLSHRGKMEFIDGYAFIGESRNRIYQSAINDLSTWNDSEYIGRTIVLDPPQGLMKHRNHLCFFGEDTVEVFTVQASTGSGSILGRIPYSAQRVGMSTVAGSTALDGHTHYYTILGDMAFFLGRLGGRGTDEAALMYYNGKTFEKVSRSIEDKILSSTTVYSINSINFHGKVAVAIQITAPNLSTQKWLMYFPDINDWFEWESTVFGPVNNGVFHTGVANEQKLYHFATLNQYQDDATNYTMTVQFRLPFDDYRWRTMSMCGVIADTTPFASNLGVSFSDDDGQNWSTARNIDMNTKKKEITGCGGFRERMVRLTHTDSREVRIRKFYSAINSKQ